MATPRALPSKIAIRGYVKKDGDRFVAVALRPYLVVEGKTVGEANHRMGQLIEAYLDDAVREGTFDAAMARKAPLPYRLRYWSAYCLHAMNRSFQPFTRTCCVPQHA